MDLDFVSIHKNAKKELSQYQAISYVGVERVAENASIVTHHLT